jgi:hypothetical protein
MIAIKLDKNISCEFICESVQKLINQRIDNNKDSILIIDIKNISHDDHSMIPKLEYKPSLS